MLNFMKNFVKEEQGQDMIEYVLILAFVAIGAAAIITTVGTDLNIVWSVTSTHVSNAASVAAS
jgi:Flp pilus assembly pilin Flp